jgi:serine/threonine-protein kinase
MTPLDDERRAWRRVEAILDEALDAPPERRMGLVAERCGDDHALRARVERLLAASEAAEGHFETPLPVPAEVLRDLSGRRGNAADVEAPATGDTGAFRDRLAPGDRVGAYEVEALLGRGGMGAVYLARRADGAFDRAVALKVVKRGMDTDEILGRFRQEREILARLQHPSIATLLDGGVGESGVPYFAMEVVRGEPIDAWCASRKLDTRARLSLVAQVCDAVAYAHRSLIVHRDLKPSNILVLPDGRPKLLDFGIAKLLEEGVTRDFTSAMGQRLTPDYAAPEQVKGEPTTTATDVYALGVILYELLSGCSPWRGAESPGEVIRRVAEGSVPPPSRVAPAPLAAELRGDLDAIVMKAMRTAPERRYTSVQALAQDIERFLTGLPVEARPDSLRYRVGKFVGRNRLVVVLAAAGVLALIAGTVSTSVMAYVADGEREQREVEAARARAARDFVVELFAGLDPDRLDGRSTFTRDELIELGIRNLDDLEGQPTLRAGILNTLGQLAFNLGDRDRAETFFRGAYDLLAVQEDSPDLATSMLGLGEVLRARLRFTEAEGWLARAVEVNRRLLPPRDPRIAESQAALAFALYNQGPDRYAEAEEIYEDLMATAPALPAPVVARISEGFADLRYGQERFAEAEELYRRALGDRVEVVGRRDSDVARTLWGLGHTLMAQGAAPEAVEVYGESLDILTRIHGERHADVAWAHYNLGSALAATQASEKAAAAFETAARLMEELNPPGYLYAAFAWQRLGRVEERLDRFASAEDSYRAALAVYDAVAAGGGSVDVDRVAALHRAVARTLVRRGRSAAALGTLRLALRQLPPDDGAGAAAASLAGDMAQIFGALGRADSAAVYRARAAALDGRRVSVDAGGSRR